MKAFVRTVDGVEYVLAEGSFGTFPGDNGDVLVMDRNAWESPPAGLAGYLTEIEVGTPQGIEVPVLAMVKALQQIQIAQVSAHIPPVPIGGTTAAALIAANTPGWGTGNLSRLANALAETTPDLADYWLRVNALVSDHPDILQFAPLLGFTTPERIMAWFALGQVFEAKVVDAQLRTARKDALLALFP